MRFITTRWNFEDIFKYISEDGETIIFVEPLRICDSGGPFVPRSYEANIYSINSKDHIYSIEFEKKFTDLTVDAKETNREDVFIELFKNMEI